MLGLSAGHLLILGIIVLLFGGKRLPELGSSMGKALHAFKSAMEGRVIEDHSNRTSTSFLPNSEKDSDRSQRPQV